MVFAYYRFHLSLPRDHLRHRQLVRWSSKMLARDHPELCWELRRDNHDGINLVCLHVQPWATNLFRRIHRHTLLQVALNRTLFHLFGTSVPPVGRDGPKHVRLIVGRVSLGHDLRLRLYCFLLWWWFIYHSELASTRFPLHLDQTRILEANRDARNSMHRSDRGPLIHSNELACNA